MVVFDLLNKKILLIEFHKGSMKSDKGLIESEKGRI